MKKFMIMTVAAMAMVLSAVASSATTFAYQGVLRDEDGKPLVDTKTVTIDFKLYESSDGDTALWGRQMTVAIDTNGLFNAELADANGSVTVKSSDTLADVIANAEAKQNVSLYIGLTVKDSTGEIRPRQKLLSVPMTAYAQDAAEAKGDFKVGGELQVTGNIGSEDGFVNVKGINVSGSSASSFSTPVDFTSGVTIGGSDSTATNLIVNGALEMKGNICLAKDCKVLLNGKYEATMPVGTITIWGGSSSALPPGWVICAPRNGKTVKYKSPYDSQTYSVPDLRGRFVVGANFDSENGQYEMNTDFSEYKPNVSKGGQESVTLTEKQIPSHRHEYLGDDVLTKINHDAAVALTGKDYKFDLSSQEQYNGVKYNTAPTGEDQPHENRPPYYALCYIIFIGDNEVE